MQAVLGKAQLYGLGHWAARSLGLDDWQEYTGHTWRRTAATAAANSGASIPSMLSHFGWHSPAMPQQYIDTSERAIGQMADALQTGMVNPIVATNAAMPPAANTQTMPNMQTNTQAAPANISINLNLGDLARLLSQQAGAPKEGST
eukprot:TRINITY_DN28377_c0_g1_i1.p2 TRINITY_DN28377_c0_g1~~TRINITY_DN28377_c0_g1_i1.p2  ORF type:complete len:146 (-),score=32.70 TRINITY_DN28377_c0_g1_i1:25-462(-)